MAERLRIGVMMTLGSNVREEIGKVREFGLDNCQLNCWDPSQYTDERAAQVRAACAEFGVEITSLWTGYSGPAVWNFVDGPATIGLVPPEHRERRTAELIAGAEFAAKIEAPCISTHAGFLPENPRDPLYEGTIRALRRVAERCRELGLGFAFETGQETPVALLRAMRDVGTDNLGVNLDPANLLMYGKANPVDALDLLGPHLMGLHAKDGDYPSDPRELGPERPLGEGRVDFPRLVAKAKAMGYRGSLTIEREISGDRQIADIRRAIELLTPLL
ncbi:MAG: sugar phosphate isomerase/epimerase [Fimbriimonadales bacterium]|nr:sugar phosphate isomerase/epimerase [Fimbriimonadales bacterium]